MRGVDKSIAEIVCIQYTDSVLQSMTLLSSDYLISSNLYYDNDDNIIRHLILFEIGIIFTWTD